MRHLGVCTALQVDGSLDFVQADNLPGSAFGSRVANIGTLFDDVVLCRETVPVND